MPDAAPTIGGSETVLVVEDQPSVREYTATVLETYGYRVIRAEDADAALMFFDRKRERVDLVLTDVVMPNVNGRELANRLKELDPRIKVLFMSGYTDDVAQHGVLDETDKLIQKPFTPEQLAGKVREVLGGAAAAGGTVLLADDSARVRKILSEILREAGYTVVEAGDGLEAIERLQECPVQLALLDTNMPMQGGLDAAREIRRQRPEVKIVLMSAAFERTGGFDLAALRVDGVLRKPAEPGELLGTVRRLLASQDR
jgi:CheY-like chemotaxis protein